MGNYRSIDRRLLLAALIIGLLAVLYLRLIPFDVDLSGGLAAIPARFTWQPLSIKDIPLNLLILVPFSFGLAGLLYQSGRSWSRTLLITVLCTFAISTAIEITQVYIPERVPSLMDITTNTLSAVLGVWLYRLAAYGFRRTLVHYVTPVNVLIGLAVYGGVIALLTGYLLWSVGLSTWDASYPLTVGNENTDFRPWEGEVSQVTLLGRSVNQDEAADLLAGSLPADTLASYHLEGPGPYPDQQGNLPVLNWLPNSPTGMTDSSPVVVGANQWLGTNEAITPFNAQALDDSGFTIAGDFASLLERQRGPARIISVSANKGHRNITVGQQGDALSIRLRTPSSGENGEKPEMIISGFFAPPQPHRVILTYDVPNLTLWVDQPDNRYGVSLAPGLALFQDFAQTNRWLVEFPANPHLYDYRYWSLAVIPALLAAVILLALHDAARSRAEDPTPQTAVD